MMIMKIKFEEALQKLDNEVKRLESGELSLDEALVSFEESVKLVKLCNERLESAERRVRILTEGEDGVVTDSDFENSISDET